MRHGAAAGAIGRLFPALGVVVLALLPYVQSATFEATYDDHQHLSSHPLLESPRAAAILFSTEYLDYEFPDQGRPTFLVSLFADRALFGRSIGAAHLASAAWHALAALLVLALAGSLGFGRPARFAAAALFAVHPACTEAVASVSNREDVLATVFTIAALLAARRFVRGGWAWLAPAGLAFLLALGSKESAVVAPLLFGVLAASSPAWRPETPRPRVRLAALGLVALLAIGTVGALQYRLGAPSLRIGAGSGPLTVGPQPLAAWMSVFAIPRPIAGLDVGWAQVLPIGAFRALRLLVGWPLSAEHDVGWLRTPFAVVIGGLVWVALLGAVVLSHRRGRVWSLGIGWAFVASIPTLASPWLLNPVADRYLYTPVVGVCLALGATLAAHRWPPLPRLALLGALSFALPMTATRAAVWQDDVILFTDAVSHAPRSARAWQNLGAAYASRGELDRAAFALERAGALQPDLVAPWLNLGAIEARRGHPDRAIEHYARAARIDPVAGEEPLHARAFEAWARALHFGGRRDELRRAVDEELARRPGSSAAASWGRRLSHAAPPNE